MFAYLDRAGLKITKWGDENENLGLGHAGLFGLAGSAWCQGARPQTAADLAKYLGPDRERLLYEGAKKEGKLVWYTSLTSYKEIAKSFEARYPGVTVEPYRAPAVNLATRTLGEAQARRYIVDAFETTQGALMLLRDNKLLLSYASPHLGEYPEGSKEKAPGGLFFYVVNRESYPGIGYNKNAVRESEVAKNFDDLLKPALKGKIGISGEEIGNRVIGAMVKAKGEGFIKSLAVQDIKLYGLPALGLNELIVSGEVPLTFTAVDSNIQTGRCQGSAGGLAGSGISAGELRQHRCLRHSQHPHAALLFVDFVVGPEGQKLFSDKLGYGSPRQAVRLQSMVSRAGFETYDYAANY